MPKRQNVRGFSMKKLIIFCVTALLLTIIFINIDALKIMLIKLKLLFFVTLDIGSYASILALIAILSIVIFVITNIFLRKEPRFMNDFWEHQSIAKRKIVWLNMLFFVMLCFIFIIAFSLFQIIFLFATSETSHIVVLDFGEFRNVNIDLTFRHLSLFLSFALIAIIGGAYIFMSFKMRKNGIKELARSLNAREIFYRKPSKLESQLLNIVEEMAIASNMPMPRVFIMKDENSINAMCSGENFGKVNEKNAIFVTRGALKKLTREEMQGVIAHEFSHAFHGDVALNMKIFSLIFALTVIMKVGELLMQGFSNSKNKNNDKGGKGAIAVIFIILLIYALGFLGAFFAQIIQAAISRQKEFLADASSVQYTRNVNGIKSALQKLKYLQDKQDKKDSHKIGKLKNKEAKYFSYMFFLPVDARFLSTHPTLEKRILALEHIG